MGFDLKGMLEELNGTEMMSEKVMIDTKLLLNQIEDSHNEMSERIFAVLHRVKENE